MFHTIGIHEFVGFDPVTLEVFSEGRHAFSKLARVLQLAPVFNPTITKRVIVR